MAAQAARLLAALVAALASAADEPALRRNVTLTFPITSKGWRSNVKQTSAMFGGRVGALLVFARPDDAFSVGPLAGAVASELGREMPLYIGFVGDADDGTLGDDTLGFALPHVELMLPTRAADPREPPALRAHAAWSKWPPIADLSSDGEARRDATAGVVAMVRPALEECADDGLCAEVMDPDVFKEAHRRLHEVTLEQGRGATKPKRRRKRGKAASLLPEDPTKEEL